MRANEICERTAERLMDFGIAPIIPGNERNVLFVATPEPCIILCRARLREKSKTILQRAGEVPVLLVQNEKDIERAAQLLSFQRATGEAALNISSLALWRAA